MPSNYGYADYAARLNRETACPACGAGRNLIWGVDPAKDSGLEPMLIAAYECSATFRAVDAGIVVGDACPGSSQVAAEMLKYEAHFDARDALKGRAA